MIAFWTPGIPVPQGSKRFVPHRATGRPLVLDSNSAKLKPWRTAVAMAARIEMSGKMRLVGPVVVEARFYFPRPKGHYGTGKNAGVLRAGAEPVPGVKPDLDKLVRAAGDSIAGIVMGDDCRITDIVARKRWATPSGPGAWITVRPWSPDVEALR